MVPHTRIWNRSKRSKSTRPANLAQPTQNADYLRHSQGIGTELLLDQPGRHLRLPNLRRGYLTPSLRHRRNATMAGIFLGSFGTSNLHGPITEDDHEATALDFHLLRLQCSVGRPIGARHPV